MFQWINILILIAIIVVFSRKKLSLYFKERRRELDESMSEAEEDLQEIQKQYDETKAKIDHLQAHLQQIKDEAGYSLDREMRKIREDSKQFSEKIRRDNEAKMNQSFEQAKRQVEFELIEIAIAAARTKLESRFAEKDPEWTDQMIQSAATNLTGKSNYAS